MPKKRVSKLDLINKKLDKILAKENKQLKRQKKGIEEREDIEDLEKEQLKELKKLEKDFKEKVGSNPLKKITQKDVSKGLIGAFIGVISHFVFIEGVHISESFSLIRIGLMYLVALVVGGIFLYATGFRKVKQIKVLTFLPVRVFVIYTVSLVTIVLVLALFGQFSTFEELYRQVGVLSLPAMIGASAADLIGRDE